MNEMTYIWINPVAEGMYAPETLSALLDRHHCTQVRCQEDWAAEVRRKYRALVDETAGIVSDARCPMAADLVRTLTAERPESPLRVAEVEPILIHAARELADRWELRDRPKVITTPCQALAELGNRLELENTRFIPWNTLLRQWGEHPPVQRLDASPIPPGFFQDAGIPLRTITGREEITDYAAACCHSGERLVEMLYCKDGCHNGDGVEFDE